MNNKIKPTTYKLIEVIAEAMVKDTKKKIIEKRKVASKTLLNSIDYEIIEGPEGNLSIQLIVNSPADKYAQYVELGRKPGTPPPVEPIKKWARYKGIDVKYAYAISKSIGKNGIQATNIFRSIYEKYLPKITTMTEEEIAKQIEAAVVKSLESQNK